MKSTGVVNVFADGDGSGIGTSNVQLVPRSVRCRLMSVQFEQKVVSGNHYYSMKFNSGGSGGTTLLQFGYGSVANTPQVLNLSPHGILFEDGIYLVPNTEDPESSSGIESISITYQG